MLISTIRRSTFFSYNLRFVLWKISSKKNYLDIEVSSFDSACSEWGIDLCKKMPFYITGFQSSSTFYYLLNLLHATKLMSSTQQGGI